MKVLKYLSMALVALGFASCEKHEIQFKNEPLAADRAMIMIHYMVPQASSTQKSIYKMEIDGVTIVNNNAALMAVYGTAPGENKYYSVKNGNVNLKLFFGFWEDRLPEEQPDGKAEFYTDDYDKMEMVYDVTLSGLQAGKKYQVFVHSFDEDPILISDYFNIFDSASEENMTENTAEHHFINFYNMMYEKEGETYVGALQYQCQTVLDWEANTAYNKLTDEEKEDAWDGKSEWLNVGDPVEFGQSTGWIKLPMVKQVFNNAAQSRVDYRIVIPGETNDDGTPVIFQQINSAGTAYANYSDYWTAYAGRHCMHIMRGFRSDKSSRTGVTQWVRY